MGQKHSKNEFNIEDFNEIKEKLKNAYSESNKQQEEKKARGEEIKKQSLGQKIIGIIILIVLIIGVGVVFIFNLDMFFLPKNSVTITVKDQNDNIINGLIVHFNSSNNSFTIDYNENSTIEITELGVKPGDYTLTFINVPEGYICSKMMDNFTLNDGGKVKLEYSCIKEEINN